MVPVNNFLIILKFLVFVNKNWKIEKEVINMTVDATVGKPLKIISKFLFVRVCSDFLIQFHGLLSIFLIAKFIGVKAFAGVGGTAFINSAIYLFGKGLCSGATIVTAQRFGAKKEKGVRISVALTLRIVILYSIFLTIAGLLLIKPLLVAMSTPPDILQYALQYNRIMFFAMIPEAIFMAFTAILRSCGDNKSATFVTSSACILNIVLDSIFVCVFKFGVRGLAVTLLISDIAGAAFLSFFVFKKYPFLKPSKADFKIKKTYLFKQLKNGFPMAFELTATYVSLFVIQKQVNLFGSTAVAGFSMAMKIENLLLAFFVATAFATSVYTAQNYGAAKYDRIVKGRNIAILIGMFLFVAFGTIIYLYGWQIVSFFMQKNSVEIFSYVKKYFNAAIFCYPFLCILLIFRYIMQSLSKAYLPLLSTFVEIAVRVGLTISLVPVFSFNGIVYGTVIAWIVSSAFMTIFLMLTMKNVKKELCLKNERIRKDAA